MLAQPAKDDSEPLTESRRSFRAAARRALWTGLTRTRRWLDQGPKTIAEVDRGDVNSMFRWLSASADANGATWRPQFAWPILRSAMTAKGLGIQRISAIEFGVAGGNGLLAMESVAEATETLLVT